MISVKRHALILILLGLLATVFSASTLHAASPSLCLELFTLSMGGGAVELEMESVPGVVDILTSFDGTVGGALKSFTPPPEFLIYMKSSYPQQAWSKIPFQQLPIKKRIEILEYISKNKVTSYDEDRRIPNFKVADTIHLSFKKPTSFLGKKYLPGNYDIYVADVFGALEYRSALDQNSFTGIELHLRSSSLSSGALLQSSWAFQDGLRNVARSSAHEHIVAPLPIAELKAQPISTAAHLTEYYRRANLLAEFITIGNKGIISNKLIGDNVAFGSMDPYYLQGIFEHLSEDALRNMPIYEDYKIAWVSYRAADKYDEDDVFGFEYRAISPLRDPRFQAKVLDRIENGLRAKLYITKNLHILEWLKSMGAEMDSVPDIAETFKEAWYYQPTQETKKVIAETIPETSQLDKEKLNALIDSLKDQKNRALRMLIYPWAKDSLFFGDAKTQAQVTALQIEYLQRFIDHPQQGPSILRSFIYRSGILSTVAATFDLTTDDFQNAGLY